MSLANGRPLRALADEEEHPVATTHLPQQQLADSAATSYLFRSIQESDRDRIQELHEEWFPVVYQDEFYNDLVQEQLAGKRLYTRVVVAGDDVEGGSDNQVAACVVGSFTSASRMSQRSQALLVPDKKRFRRLFYIMTLGTVTEHRGAGLATELLEWVERLVQRDTSCGGVYLHVITNNETAIRFYERLGYARVEELPDYYEIHGEKYPSYLYAKYFHGNRGHRDVVRMMARAFLSVWRHFTHIIPSSEPRSLEEGKF